MSESLQVEMPVGDLERCFQGELLRVGDDRYDERRRVWNAMVDKRPALIARPRTTADVAAIVTFARDNDLPVAVRCGGHSVAGKSVCDDGLLVDLSLMKGVEVDPERRRARANAGVLWGELDRATQAHGLATPGGRVTTTGIGGFTLGGGYGWLSPLHGLACDNLISAEVVVADGRTLAASETENAELFWGLRGGGGNFGVVTAYEFRLHPVGPTVVGGMLVYPLEAARDVLRGYRDYVDTEPEGLATAFALVTAPAEPFVPEQLHGRPVLGIIAAHFGALDDAERAIGPLRALGPPAADLIGPMPYVDFQALLDPQAPEGWRWYNTGEHLDGLTDHAIETLIEHVPRGLGALSQIIVFRHGGAVSRVPDSDTAFANRSPVYLLHPLAAWLNAEDDERHVAWLRTLVEAMRPFKTGGVYLNFMPDEAEALLGGPSDRIADAYGTQKLDRLMALKSEYDPLNMFRFNHNIRPRSS